MLKPALKSAWLIMPPCQCTGPSPVQMAGLPRPSAAVHSGSTAPALVPHPAPRACAAQAPTRAQGRLRPALRSSGAHSPVAAASGSSDSEPANKAGPAPDAPAAAGTAKRRGSLAHLAGLLTAVACYLLVAWAPARKLLAVALLLAGLQQLLAALNWAFVEIAKQSVVRLCRRKQVGSWGAAVPHLEVNCLQRCTIHCSPRPC